MSRRRRSHRRKSLGAIDYSDPKTIVVGAVGVGLLAYLLWPKSAKAETAERPPRRDNRPPAQTPDAGGGGGDSGGSGGSGGSSIPRGQKYTVAAGDSWSAIARRSYGDMKWWPFLWDHNRRVFPTMFRDPGAISVGDTIEVPLLPSNAAFRATIFARADEYTAWYKAGQQGEVPLFVMTMTSMENVSGMAGYGWRGSLQGSVGYLPDLYTAPQLPSHPPEYRGWKGSLGYGCGMNGRC